MDANKSNIRKSFHILKKQEAEDIPQVTMIDADDLAFLRNTP